jgi:hypothetical protein
MLVIYCPTPIMINVLYFIFPETFFQEQRNILPARDKSSRISVRFLGKTPFNPCIYFCINSLTRDTLQGFTVRNSDKTLSKLT